MDNQLVVLGTTAADAGRYYVQAVNERNGENKTSPSIYLNIASKLMQNLKNNGMFITVGLKYSFMLLVFVIFIPFVQGFTH